MPEIPELEKYRKKLDQLVIGERIRGLHVQRESWLNTDIYRMSAGVSGRQILYVERKGTDLIFHLDDGRRLVIKTGNGAKLTTLSLPLLADGNTADERNKEAALKEAIANSQLAILTDQAVIIINHARTCQLQWLTAKELDERQQDLGPDPLSRHLTATRFQQCFAKRRTALKTALMNPSVLAGIGSQYADEIAFAAGLLPTVRTDQLNEEHWTRLFYAMLNVYHQAIEGEEAAIAEQSTELDETSMTKETAAPQTIHGKIGEPCPRCQTTLKVMMIQRRPANFCPCCQIDPTSSDS